MLSQVLDGHARSQAGTRHPAPLHFCWLHTASHAAAICCSHSPAAGAVQSLDRGRLEIVRLQSLRLLALSFVERSSIAGPRSYERPQILDAPKPSYVTRSLICIWLGLSCEGPAIPIRELSSSVARPIYLQALQCSLCCAAALSSPTHAPCGAKPKLPPFPSLP
jgi:hypothetical protein